MAHKPLELFAVCSVVMYGTNALVVSMAKMQAVSEIAPGELIANPDDFEALAMEHAQQLYNMALRMTGSEEEAKDLCQEALLRAYKSFSRWKRECSFSSWLYRIATNLCIDQIRRRKRIRFESLDAPLVTDDGDQLTRAFESGRDPQALAEAAERERGPSRSAEAPQSLEWRSSFATLRVSPTQRSARSWTVP